MGSLACPSWFSEKDANTHFIHPGRLRHFIGVLDPRTLLASPQELDRCAAIINDWRQGVRHDDRELWDCKQLLDASVHPATRGVIPAPVRMAAVTPVNIPICFGMLNSTSPAAVLFWQWCVCLSRALETYK